MIEEVKERIKRGGIASVEALEYLFSMVEDGKRVRITDSDGGQYELVEYEWDYEPAPTPTGVFPVYYLKLKGVNGYKWITLGELRWWLLEDGDIEVEGEFKR